MSYPAHQPRRLRRSRNDRWIGGVCGGLAEYLNMDATLVRVGVVIIALVTAAVPVAAIYLLMMLLIPEADTQRPGSLGPAPRYPWQQSGWQPGQQQPWQSGQDRAPQPHSDTVWGPAGPPWRPNQDETVDTSAPQPPRQSAEDLFSRAKHPTQPSSGPSTPPPADSDQKDSGQSDQPTS
ncbi:PspC domain-containing protein [Microlunatus endophyticus]|nr:PspC domain-containing protein [Microlunatus endophyticus]